MVESGVTERGKNTASFLFCDWTQQHKQKASGLKAMIFKDILKEKQQLVEEKDADIIRKVLCNSFSQWFWELNNLILKTTELRQIICVLVSTKSTVLIRSGYSYVAVEVKV